MRSLKHFLLLALLTTGCVTTDDNVDLVQTPILGGTPASVGQYPTVVAILNNGLCTGTLIGPDLVLTAAHCISPAVLGYYNQAQVTADTNVIVDTTNAYGSSGRVISASDTIPHPSFSLNSLGDNDIGLIRLAQSVTDRTPTVLNRSHSDAPAGISTALVGYGLTNPSNQNSAGYLYALTNKLSMVCNSYLGSDSLLLCYDQSDGRGSCSGDSGGPAFASIGGSQKVVGITSFGDQYCQEYGAYTRVDAELAFIDANAPELTCVSDGTCVADCGSGGLPSDPDCAGIDCSANGVCVAECGSGGFPVDPDCATTDCSANGVCVAECGSDGLPEDPDCSTETDCSANGVCVAECGSGGLPEDPDCAGIDCTANGVCVAECGSGSLPQDPDCTETPGGIGSICDDNEDCISGLCGEGPGGKLCSELCDPAASDCPDGFECLVAGDSGACWPSSGDEDDPNSNMIGGCAVSSSSSSGVGALPLFMLCLMLAVTRRRRCAR